MPIRGNELVYHDLVKASARRLAKILETEPDNLAHAAYEFLMCEERLEKLLEKHGQSLAQSRKLYQKGLRD